MGTAQNEQDKKDNKNAGKSTYQYSGDSKVFQDGRGRTAHRTVVRLVKLVDVIMVTIPFVAAWYLYYSQRLYSKEFFRKGNWLIIFLYLLIYYLLAHLYQGFTLHISTVSEIIYAQALGALIADGIMFIVTWLLIRHFPTAVIYDELEGVDKLVSQYGMEKRFKVVKKVNIHDLQGEDWYNLPAEERDRREAEFIPEVLDGIESVFLCSLHSHDRNQFVKYCISKDIMAWCVPRIGDVIMASAEKQHLFHLPMLMVEKYNPTPEYLIQKRAFDIVVAGLALILFSPIMAILAVVIRMDGGTAFYRQKRLTKDGKVFEILKFRSMRMDAEKDGVARLSSGEADPRITKVGRFIRACRLDELPQLINIIKGDMSIVGPRPERPEIAEEYKKDLPEFDLRLQCKCGLTGFAQVYGQYNTTPYDKLLMDLMYIAQPSMVEDLKICFATVKILFMKDSTEGIAEGQTTAKR